MRNNDYILAFLFLIIILGIFFNQAEEDSSFTEPEQEKPDKQQEVEVKKNKTTPTQNNNETDNKETNISEAEKQKTNTSTNKTKDVQKPESSTINFSKLTRMKGTATIDYEYTSNTSSERWSNIWREGTDCTNSFTVGHVISIKEPLDRMQILTECSAEGEEYTMKKLKDEDTVFLEDTFKDFVSDQNAALYYINHPSLPNIQVHIVGPTKVNGEITKEENVATYDKIKQEDYKVTYGFSRFANVEEDKKLNCSTIIKTDDETFKKQFYVNYKYDK